MLLLLEGKTIRCYGLHKVILGRQPALLHVSMHVWRRIATPGQAGNRSNHQRRTSTTAHWRKLTGVRFLGRASLPRQAGPTVPQLRLDLVLARCRTAPVFVFLSSKWPCLRLPPLLFVTGYESSLPGRASSHAASPPATVLLRSTAAPRAAVSSTHLTGLSGRLHFEPPSRKAHARGRESPVANKPPTQGFGVLLCAADAK